MNECGSATQTIQLAWNGGVTPYINGDTEADLYQYYIGYSDSSGVLIPHIPISIADINDNDNFHQLCFNTNEEIVKISIMANTVEDPNLDPNAYSEVAVSYCPPVTSIEEKVVKKAYKVYPNPFLAELSVQNLLGDEYFMVYDFFGRKIVEGKCYETIKVPDLKSGMYVFVIQNNSSLSSHILIKK